MAASAPRSSAWSFVLKSEWARRVTWTLLAARKSGRTSISALYPLEKRKAGERGLGMALGI